MTTRERLADIFPAFALEVRTPRLTLRFPDDDDLLALADVAVAGVHPPDEMPFKNPWTQVPSPFLERNSLQFFWSHRLTLQGDAPRVSLVVVIDDGVVGIQALETTSWKGTRSFETGSWLGLAHQGKGIGKEMRIAALQLGFDGFGAERMVTAAYADNRPSIGVTEAMGYRPNGNELTAREGAPTELLKYTMLRSDFDAIRRDDIEIVGAQAVVEMFGTEKVPGAEAGS